MSTLLYKYKCLVAILICILSTAIVYAQPVIETKPNAAGMLDELNKWRTAIGLRPLGEDVPLSMAAQFHVDDMLKRNYFAHIAPSPVACGDVMVKEPPQRVACFGRAGRGEDLAGDNSPEDAVRALIADQPHCVDVLKPIYTSMGGGNTDRTYAIEFDGQVDPQTMIDIKPFCVCASGNASEGHLQDCAKQFNDRYNGGAVPATLPVLPLQVKMRLPADQNRTYDKNSSGGQTIGAFAPGTLTVKIIPVAGNPSGIPIELGDDKFKMIPDAKGIDQVVYNVTTVSQFSVNFTSWSLAPDDKFTVEITWLPADAASNAPVEATTVPAEAPVDATAVPAAEATCSASEAPDAMDMIITNKTDQPLSLVWIDPQCNETAYGTVEPGTSLQQGTFVGHAWVLRYPDGTVAEQFVASTDRPEIIIEGAAAVEPTAIPTEASVDATAVPAAATICSAAEAPDAMNIIITNNTDQPLSLIWIDEQCNEIDYGTVEAGTSRQQGTFVGHEWVLRYPDGTIAEQFTASTDRPEIVVGAAQNAEATENTTDAASTSVCSVSVSSVDELVNAINQSNDETACPGPDTLFVISDIQVSASYEGGENAFPTITSTITISSMNREIARDPNASEFRFFYVDATKGNLGNLTLEDIKLSGGSALDAGAVFVDARDGGQSSFRARNVSFVDNKSNGNGGALLTLSLNGGQVDAVIEDSLFDNNSGVYGGAFYSGGFDGGNATATITNTNFTNNKASAEGGAIYNNGLGNGGHAQMTLQDLPFTNTASPLNDVIQNNGRAGGDAVVTITKNQFGGSGISLGENGLIFNQGTEGSATVTWESQQAGGSENVCVGNGNDTLEVVACPA